MGLLQELKQLIVERLLLHQIQESWLAQLADFAAESVHRSDFNFMPTEQRLYFTRK